MKKAIITALVAISLVAGAYGQGAIELDNSTSQYGLKIGGNGVPEHWYEGTFGLEVWFKNGTNYDIQAFNGLRYDPLNGSYILQSNGFTLAGSFVGLDNTGDAGGFFLGQLNIPGVNPAGSPITLALLAWTGSGSKLTGGIGGTVAFYTSTADYTIFPVPTPPSISKGWDAAGVDLLFAVIPEPSTVTVAGLCSLVFVVFRRRA